MSGRKAKAQRRAGPQDAPEPDPAVVDMLLDWAFEHPGEFRMHSPTAPRFAGEKLDFYVVHPPSDDALQMPGWTPGPEIAFLKMTAEEGLDLARKLGVAK